MGVETPFVQKLGIPRQPSLAPSVKGRVILNREFAREDTLRGIESFSHLWILYWCHKSDSWRETIRPPRLGGKEKVGFLATRSPHRPNPIGLSVVKFEGIDSEKGIDAFITGEVSEKTIHTAREMGIHFYACGHHATERYGVQAIAGVLQQKFDVEIVMKDIDNPA